MNQKLTPDKVLEEIKKAVERGEILPEDVMNRYKNALSHIVTSNEEKKLIERISGNGREPGDD